MKVSNSQRRMGAGVAFGGLGMKPTGNLTVLKVI